MCAPTRPNFCTPTLYAKMYRKYCNKYVIDKSRTKFYNKFIINVIYLNLAIIPFGV